MRHEPTSEQEDNVICAGSHGARAPTWKIRGSNAAYLLLCGSQKVCLRSHAATIAGACGLKTES